MNIVRFFHIFNVRDYLVSKSIESDVRFAMAMSIFFKKSQRPLNTGLKLNVVFSSKNGDCNPLVRSNKEQNQLCLVTNYVIDLLNFVQNFPFWISKDFTHRTLSLCHAIFYF